MAQFDSVYINGKIFTCDEDFPEADTLAVTDGKISFIGFSKDVNLAGENIIDLRGKRILPGLIDCHIHPVMLASNLSQIACLPPYVHNIPELIEALQEKRNSIEDNKNKDLWILGWGLDEAKLEEHRSPNRYDLDAGCSDYPVCLLRSCVHARYLNSKALELAGIDENTVSPPGGEIEKDENGIPTGVLRENAMKLVLPLLPVETDEDTAENLALLSGRLSSQGITSVGDLGNHDSRNYYDIFSRARAKGFKQRCGIYYLWDKYREKPDFKLEPETMNMDNPIRVCGLKLLGDGGISGRTAWTSRPYQNGDDCGISTCSDEEIQSAIDFCKKYHGQLSIHCMGQRAIEQAVRLISKEEDWLGPELPHARIEHASMPTEYSLKTSAESDIAYVLQPIFLYAESEGYLKNLGLEWLQSTFPVKDIKEAGIRMAFSTDAPATPLTDSSNPMLCIKSAVTRTACDGTDCGQAHRVSAEEAVKLYTAEGAYMMGFAGTGMLKSGYHADFIVLDRDIFAVDPEDIDKIKVEQTYIEGEQVYQREK